MDKELIVLIGGGAGQGVAKAAEILGKIFVNLGYFVFNYRDYQSLIRGGHNYNVLKISNEWVGSHEEEGIDFILALNQETIDLHKNKLKENGKIFCDINIKADKKIGIDIDNILEKAGAKRISENIVLISALCKYLGIDKEIVKKVIKEELKDESNIKIVEIVYEEANIDKTDKIQNIKKGNLYFFNGSEAIALGAIAAGLDLYIAYPMTPATPVLHILAKLQEKYDIRVYQPENEIAVANIALGASYAGAKVMVGTSGGGFALMSEALSLQGISEIPLVVYLSQRYAPATGIPTYTSQGDLKFALNVGHGEFPRVVVAPGDAMEAFRRTIEAFYLSYKYRVLSIILGDKHLAESHFTYDKIECPPNFVSSERFIELNPEIPYFTYKLTDTGISPRAVPGIKNEVVVKATSYEHDEYGITTEDGDWACKMNLKRWKKYKVMKEEIEKMEPFKIYGKGNKLIVSWGSTKGAIIDALKELKDYSFLQIIYLSPFSSKIKEILKNFDEIILVENNVTGLLGKVIRENTGIKIEKRILKCDARPFTSKYLIREIRKWER